MKLKSLSSIAHILADAGYPTTQDEDALFVELRYADQVRAAVLELEDGALHVTCQLARLSDFDQDQLSLVAVNALAANVEMLPYAFAIIKPADGADADAVSDSPLVLINSVPIEDLSEDELLWDIQRLQSALIAGTSAIATALNVSRTA
jgi:hypothetical protein